ncbi:MAG: YfhO family protein, partial [Flavobacteriaceae bacterium]
KDKKLKHFFVSVGILIAAVALSIATNATNLMATKEYADWSTRGKSELTINPDGSPKEVSNGLDRDYITYYSYGITESLDLFVPRMFGGSGNEDIGKNSKVYEYLTSQGLSPTKALEVSGLYLYWGPHPASGPAGPAYVGAIIVFLFILGLILIKGKKKWWLLFGTILSLLLSWGKNFPALTDFMIDNFPLYNKFRAVSSIQVVLELCFPVLAILGLRELFKTSLKSKQKIAALKLSFFITLGLGVFIFLLKSFFDFEGSNDETYRQYFGDPLLDILRRDREAVYVSDTIRSLIFVLLTAVALWLFIKNKIGKNLISIVLGALLLFDLIGVNLRYVNEDDFVRQRNVNTPFQASQIDQLIQQDDSIFRVFDPQEGLNGSKTSYFHKSIGGYHAAKPRQLQNLFEYHLYQNNIEVLNMLNVKYIIQQDEEGNSFPAVNDNANGNGWFVDKLVPVNSANDEIQELEKIDSKTEAVVNTKIYPTITKLSFQTDSLARIRLTDYRPNYIQYQSNTINDGFAVFSEMHYPKGWNAFIDGKAEPHYKVNYALRGMKVPAGQHEIEFKFEPEVIQTGSQITLASCILLGVIVIGGFGFSLRPKKSKTKA